MASIDNRNPWTPYSNYRDCSQGICSIYCRQYCFLFFPPPPPPDDDSGPPFSPLIIAMIGVLASIFLLVSYYTIVRRYCRRRNAVDTDENRDELGQDQWRIASAAATGLDEAVIKTITVCKYQKGDGLIEGTECAVCLSEFREEESLRLLPKCSHAFHLPCIDTWLKSQPNCPLCRAGVVGAAHPPPNLTQTSSDLSVNRYQVRPPVDLVLVVEDDHERTAVIHGDDADDVDVVVDDAGNQTCGNSTNADRFRRSVSLGTFSPGRKLLISDILKDHEDIDECMNGSIGSSNGLVTSPVGIKRSISTGRFAFLVQNKGKNSLLPH